MKVKILLLTLFLLLPGLNYADVNAIPTGVERIGYSGTLRSPVLGESASFFLCGESQNMSLDACLGMHYTWRATGSADPESFYLVYEINSNTNPQVYASYGVDPIAVSKRWLDIVFPGSTDPGYVYRATFGVRYKFADFAIGISQVRVDGFGSVNYYDSTQATFYWYFR